MGRIVKNWTSDQVDATPVAPHRYTWNREYEREPKTYSEWRATVPYGEGDVVFHERGDNVERVRILAVFAERDRYGERRERFRVQRETAKGVWSKVWEYTSPGFIQRGYKRAGLAPDIPD